MKGFQKWVLILGVSCGLDPASHGQVTSGSPSKALTITGTVFDPSGTPAPGVAVVFMPVTGNEPAESDTQGRYTVSGLADYGRFSLVARDIGHNFVAFHGWEEETTNLDIHLKSGVTISAKVRDIHGNPITNAGGNLLIRNATGSRATQIASPVNADDQGLVRFAALPQDSSYQLYIYAPGYGAAKLPPILEADTRTSQYELSPVVLNLATLKLSGQVFGVGGKPAAGVSVVVSGDGQPNTNFLTDTTGHFSVLVCDGLVVINSSDVLGKGPYGHVQTVGGDTNVIVRFGSNIRKGPDGASITRPLR